MSLAATVSDRFDDGSPRLLRDEDGGLWATFTDAMDGTIAVNEVCSDGETPAGRAGIFVWFPGAMGQPGADGYLTSFDGGKTYGVGNSNEFVISGGQWREADSA